MRSLFEDREGNLWVGTNTGLNSYHDGRFTLYSRLEGSPAINRLWFIRIALERSGSGFTTVACSASAPRRPPLHYGEWTA